MHVHSFGKINDRIYILDFNTKDVWHVNQIGVECNESKSSSTVFGVSWTDSLIPVLFEVALTELLIEDPNGFEGESPIGRVSVVVFPPF